MIGHEVVLIRDRGLYTYAAEDFAKSAKEVLYFMPDASTYPESTKDCIGTDLDGVERVYDFDAALKRCDWVYFPDCYDGLKQMALREQGYPVFGEGGAGKLEMDKEFFYQYLESIGLPVPYTFIAEDFDEALKYLECKKDKWIKPADSYSRGDFETFHWVNSRQARRWVNSIRQRLGIRCDDLRLLIQDSVPSVCEPGFDGLNVFGKVVQNGMIGYEDKDKALLGKVFLEIPKIVKDVNDAMASILGELGCQGHWTTEMKIAEDSTTYFLDPTLRRPSPSGEAFNEVYEDYSDACSRIAKGEVPKLKFKKRFIAQAMLYSSVYESEQICVEFPEKYTSNIKLKSHTKSKDKDGSVYYTCIPNNNGGYFGGVVAVGDSTKECKEKVMGILGEIQAEGLDFDASSFDRIDKAIEAGERFGINFK
jgi:hypothetical protein